MLSRLDVVDLFHIWLASFVIVAITTLGLKYSIIASVFASVNFVVLHYWFSVPILPSTDHTTETFLNDLQVGAHRGGALDGPENTIGAFDRAISLGAHAIEFDLQLTKDGVVVLFHDDEVDRTTDGEGDITSMRHDEVLRLNAAAKFVASQEYPKETVPTFEEGLKKCLAHNLKIFIDVKNCNPQVISAIVAMFKKYPDLYQLAAVCSFFPQLPYEIKRLDGRILTAHTWRRGFFAFQDIECQVPRYNEFWMHLMAQAFDYFYEWFLHSWLWKFTGANLVLIHEALMSTDYVNAWRARGLGVVAWTVNDYYQKLYFLKTLKVPLLTDSLADITDELSRTNHKGQENATKTESKKSVRITGV